MKLISRINNILSPNNFNFIHQESVESTMISIKKFIGNQNICMLADEQTSGIGRRGNEWVSPKGNIYISFLIKYDLSIENHFLFSALTANSIVKFLDKYIGENTNIKWPNDILIDSKKVAGILVENSIRGSKIEKSIVGIGVNINNNISQLPSATSLADCLNTIPTVSELLELICKNIEKNYFLLKQKPSMINELYHQNLFQKGGVQKFSKNGESFDGIINSVNDNGQLLVEVNGRLEFYNMGEIKFMI